MKKVLLLLLLLLLSLSVLFADIDYIYLGTTGGYSTPSESPTFGFNTAYQYMANLGNSLYFGINTHLDINMVFEKDDVGVGVGALVGPSFAISFNPSNFLTLTAGPAIYIENISTDYQGFGLGVDINHTIFINSEGNFGITFGTTGYFMFANLADDSNNKGFAFDGTGYIGFTYRSGDYSGEKVYYNIY